MNRTKWRRIIVAYEQYHVLTSKYQSFVNIYNRQTTDMLASRPYSFYQFRKFNGSGISYNALKRQLKRKPKLP